MESKCSPIDDGTSASREPRSRTVDPLYLQPARAQQRWGIGKTSLYKALNGKLPGSEHLPKIIVVKFGAATLIHVPSGDAFFSQLPRYNLASSDTGGER